MAHDTDAFELKRLMRQEAHEKAFEFQVMGQREFERCRDRDFQTGKSQANENHQKRMKKMDIDQKIEFSKSTNENRIARMVERNKQLEKCREAIKEDIKEAMQDEGLYKDTLQKMIVQGMIKLLEEEVEIKIRDGDQRIVNSIKSRCEREFQEIMEREVQDKEYKTNLIIRDDAYLNEEEGSEYGGVIMYAHKRKIVVANTLLDRVNLVFEQ
jgi:V-type H+-transporting ATPase subunit E